MAQGPPALSLHLFIQFRGGLADLNRRYFRAAQLLDDCGRSASGDALYVYLCQCQLQRPLAKSGTIESEENIELNCLRGYDDLVR